MKKYLFFGIIMIAAALRLWQIGQVPASPDWDEAALGYNAYSVLKTGRDEYGTWFPMVLRSFDDYKPPLYMYLTIPSVAIFGLETWAVRLPSAIAGVLAVVGTYCLVLELFKSRRLALIASFLLAISPWHIQFSRIAFEANIGVTINIWAVYLFLKGLQKEKLLMISAFLFGLGFYAYHSERIFLPLLVVILSLIFRQELAKRRREVLVAAIIGFITIAPILFTFLDPATLSRIRGTSSFADQTPLLSRSVAKLEQDQRTGNPWGVIFDNRRLVWMSTVVEGYLSHFSLKWIFLTGDNPRHHAPDTGLLYLVELPFVLWGLYHLVIDWKEKSSRLILFWFLAAPIAAAPTTGLPHAIRTLVFLPTFQIMTAIGIKKLPSRFFPFFVLVFVLNVIFYLHMYFGHMNREYSQFWQYGYKQAVDYVKANNGKYKKIVVSIQLEQPYIFFLYYLAYDPAKYLAQGGTKSGGFEEVRNKFDIFEFRPIDWDREKRNRDELYIGTPKEIRGSVLQSILYLDGSEAIRIAQQ
ncbi:MAG: hypothetical protein UU34_C0020G0005 [Candidatus Curtissbacteria bacterium GW2011_GWA1_41_11]|uniref:Glycosyltransferase RgtA/B/C/D-like domain-containing protein n=1 Tax=Candidatus Curtissbacteria bacterium GW2011_GWA1_41_11 TaxID=1618409 RepID=A0A0G0UB01_9BACT|nr:MAG: hypothetical protein UU34_C0020G0005 [Candidatus Curtissbacteria bacterium GW2011_GWA1_41_11]